MARPILHYWIALAVCSGLAATYRITVVPWLAPAEIPIATIDEESTDFDQTRFAHLFPEGSWQLDNPRSLQADWGTLLFQHRQQISTDQWRVSPVTVILANDTTSGSVGDSRSSPLIMQAEDGAIVEFEEPLNMMGAMRPKIKGGQLRGEVRISNRPFQQTSAPLALSTPTAALGQSDTAQEIIDLQTSNVRIDSREIRSTDALSLQIGQAKLRGKDFTIQLAGGGSIPTDVGSPREILDKLELIYLDELTVPLPEGPLWQPLDRAPVSAPASMDLRCQGRVVFDFPTFTLRLGESVEIAHRWLDQRDVFYCEQLDLQFVDSQVLGRPSGTSAPSSPSSDPWAASYVQVSSVLRGIRAVGNPLRAEIPSLQSRLVAGNPISPGRLTVDLSSGLLSLDGGRGGVTLRHRELQLIIPGCEYQIDPTRPSRLGSLVCSGRGQLIGAKEIALQSLQWNQSLKLLPHTDGHQLRLDGNVVAKAQAGLAKADQFGLIFESPELASKPTPPIATQPPGNPVRPASTRTERTGGPNTENVPTFVAKRMWAKGGVVVDTMSLAAETDSLFVEIESLPATPQSNSQSSPFSLGPQLFPATGPRKRAWITGPEGEATRMVSPVAQPRPRLRGKQINANLTMRGTQIVSHDVSVEQDVSLEHELQTPAGALPLVYTGQSVRLITGDGEQIVQIAGAPANIALGDGFFSGPLIVVDGNQNKVLIRDEGTFQMPSSVLPQSAEQRIHWLRPPSCRFQGELTFDGQVVEIRDQVNLAGQIVMKESGEIWDLAAAGPLLRIVLDQGIEVTDPTKAKSAGVDLVSLIGDTKPVELTATQFSPDKQMIGRHKLVNPRLNFFAKSGQLNGDGPGWYRSWTLSDADSPMRSVAPPGSLLASHLIFNGGIEGDLSKQELGFYSGVRVGMSAVRSWEEELDAASMTQLQMNQGVVDCERLAIGRAVTTVPNASNMPWELRADGGVAFQFATERGLVIGSAARAAYNSYRGVFVMDGAPRRDAIIRHLNPQTGRELMRWNLQQITVNPTTMFAEGAITGARVQAPPTTAPPRGYVPPNR